MKRHVWWGDEKGEHVHSFPTDYNGGITIPSTANGYKVTRIGSWAFSWCGGLTSVNIPETVTSIGTQAFNFTGITEIDFPNSLESIADFAFQGCYGLTSMFVPKSVTNILPTAFGGGNISSIIVEDGNPVYDSRDNCNAVITTATNELLISCNNTIIPKTITRIASHGLAGYSDTASIVIPAGVTYIGHRAFWGHYNLTVLLSMIKEPMVVTFDGGCWDGINPDEITLCVPKGTKGLYEATEGWNVFKNITEVFEVDGINYTVTSPDEMTVEVTSGGSYEGDVVIPEKVEFGGNEFSVTSIGEEAFCGCRGLTSIVIPEGVTSIGGYAFKFCSGLTSFAIPESVTSIGDDAFSECSGLTSITIPEGLTSIGDYAFWACSNLTSIVVDAGNTAYTSANGSNAIIEKATNTLIRGCANTIIPEDVTSIGGGAFTNSSGLTSITIPKGVTSICHHAFAGCSDLTSITILEGVTRIGEQAFIYAGLTSVTLPNSLEITEYGAFQCCKLNSIFIPKSVTSIAEESFEGNLNSIVVDSDNPIYDSRGNCNAIIKTATNELIRGCKNTIIPKTVTKIGCLAFCHCASDFTSIVIPESVTSIGHRAFWGNDNMAEILSLIKEPMAVTFDDGCWEGINPDEITLYVPKGTKELYEATEGWSVFKDIIEKEDAFFVDNAVYLNDTVARQGGKTTLSLKMKNTAAIRGFQFDLYLPEGVTVAKSSKGKILGALSEGRLPDEDEHSLTFSEQPDGAIRFLCSSQYDETFTGNDGEIATLQLNVAEDVAEGDYEIQLKNMKLTESDIDNYYETALLKSKLTVEVYTLGDVNSDNLVDVSDYTGVANHIHGATPQNFFVKAADVDENGTIDVSDYTGIANIIHTGNIYGIRGSREMSRSPKKENTDLSGNDNVIYVEPFAVTPGTPTTISIKMKNTAAIRGFQFDLYLPEGMTVVKSSKGRIQGALSAGRLPEEDEHELTFSERPDGAIRFLCSSQYDETFTGTDGEIATLQVNVAEGMADGNYALLLKNMKLTETDIRNYYETDEVETTVSVLSTAEVLKGDVTGEGNVNAADVTALVNYILGRGTLANEAAAYVNDDDKIDIQDVTALIELVK